MIMEHRFVEFVPEQIQEGILYISIEYCTAIHLCVCGCQNRVITPFSPTDWKLTFNGLHISLYPSIGNWSFKCQSHYWIKNSKIEFADRWTENEILSGRKNDLNIKNEYFDDSKNKQKMQFQQKIPSLTVWQKIMKSLGF